MLHRLYYHLVWTTRGREALIDARVADFLASFLGAVASEERAKLLCLGIVADHVHVLIRGHPQTELSRLVMRLKGGSAALAGRENLSAPAGPLRWDRGYSIHSVGTRVLPEVRAYIRSQHLHHPDRAIAGWPRREETAPTSPPPPRVSSHSPTPAA